MFLAAAKRTPVNLEEWAVQMMERHNRKSHLAPQLSPSTQALLRGETALSPSKESTISAPSKTPTSGDIPIAEQDLRATPTNEVVAGHYEKNGTPSYYPQHSSHDQYGYPPRSSSNYQSSNSTRSRDADHLSPTMSSQTNSRDNNYTTTTLPIRPAPPPTGPLPQPPTTAFRNPASRRTNPNGSAFPYSDPSQY